MPNIHSNRDQFELLEDNTNQTPFVMLNLLKFEKEGGREGYFRISQPVNDFALRMTFSTRFF